MQAKFRVVLILGLALVLRGAAWADDSAESRAIVQKAIQALGGEAELGKYKAYTAKIKGDIHTAEMKLHFTGELAIQGADQEKGAIEVNIAGQVIVIMHVLNRDQGWLKIGDVVIDMDKEKLAESREHAYVGWVASLVPLKDPAFTLAPVGEVQVEGKPAIGIRASSKDWCDVNLFFDKATHLLVKTEARVKDEESGKEMTEETFLSGYEGKEVQSALKRVIKRDGKLFFDAVLSDVKLEPKLDDGVFGKP